MWIKIFITVGAAQIEKEVLLTEQERFNIDQAVDDRAADILSDAIKIEYKPLRGN